MPFKNLLNKGTELFNKGTSMVREAAKEKQEARQEFNYLIMRSEHLKDLQTNKTNNINPSTGREQKILSNGLTINVEKAKLINNIIPVEETIVNIKSATESKTSIIYFFVLTDKQLWVLNEKEYKTYRIEDIKICKLIDKNILSQYVNFDNNAFVFEGSYPDIESFCKLINDNEYRTIKTNEAKSYLCGITPKEQFLNLYLTGMTIGNRNEIVFHNGEAGNKLVELKDIQYIQLLLDNTVVMTKGKDDMYSAVSAMNDCRKMSIKVVMTNENYFFDVLPQNIMGTLIKKEDSLYITNYEFAKTILIKVEELLKQNKNIL